MNRPVRMMRKNGMMQNFKSSKEVTYASVLPGSLLHYIIHSRLYDLQEAHYGIYGDSVQYGSFVVWYIDQNKIDGEFQLMMDAAHSMFNPRIDQVD